MTNDVRQVVERLRERHSEMCDETDGMESGDAEVLRLAADLLVKLTSPPAPSGWQQRIAAMEPWGRGGHCHFCGVYRLWERDGKWVDAKHKPDCLWQNAKDALPPSSSAPADEPEAAATISAFLDQMEMHARDVEDPLLYDDIEAARKALNSLKAGFSLGQSWVSRVTNSTGPEVSVIGADVAPSPCKARRCSTPEPQDCDWPFCGCDPHATKVIEALDECGMLKGKTDALDALPPVSEASPVKPEQDVVCQHGTAMDVHCCNCHSGFLFDTNSCVCGPSDYTLRQLLQRAVDGLTQGACFTCGSEPGTNIDCAGCLWVRDAQHALKSEADASPAKDPIAAAVDAQLDPLKDALVDFGHKLAKDMP